jgi:hypothetical protein
MAVRLKLSRVTLILRSIRWVVLSWVLPLDGRGVAGSGDRARVAAARAETGTFCQDMTCARSRPGSGNTSVGPPGIRDLVDNNLTGKDEVSV